MRVIIEASDMGNSYSASVDGLEANWLGQKRNDADCRAVVIDAANALLRALQLNEINETGGAA
jgi:hypothetical protein